MLVNHLRNKERISEKTFLIIKKMVLPLGLFLLVIAIILIRNFSESKPLSFIAGVLLGLSIVVNIVGLILKRTNTKSKLKE